MVLFRLLLVLIMQYADEKVAHGQLGKRCVLITKICNKKIYIYTILYIFVVAKGIRVTRKGRC